MFFCRELLSVKPLFVFLFILSFVLFPLGLPAQTKKPTASQNNKKQTSAKTTAKNQDPIKTKETAKNLETNKNKKTAGTSQKSPQGQGKSVNSVKLAAAQGQVKSDKLTRAEVARQEDLRREALERGLQQQRRNEELRRAEEVRRQAVLEEKRRREQAIREAQARQIAFERGLKTETLANIARDSTEGEDLEARRAAISALGGHAGTVVVMEAQTGKVLTIVNQDWGIRKSFKPCSTIKLVTGVAGLNESVIDTNGNIRTRSFPMNLDDALAHSNNSYFQNVGRTVGNQKMISYARALGLGERTGINTGNESSGRLPYGNNNARIYSHGDDFEVTPLQLAVMVSAITNGGKLVVPQIPRTSVEKANYRGFMRRQVSVPQENLKGVLPGMIGAVGYGTAKRASNSSMVVAGKTGSCIGQGSWVGLFASVAPVVNPRLAVVVITRGQSERGKYASAIAGKVYKALGYRFKENGRQELIAKVPLELKPQPKINAKTSALLDNAEGEDSDESATKKNDVKQEVAKKFNPKKGGDDRDDKRIDKTANLFSPIVIRVNREPTRQRIVQNEK